jgi:hypothetical protein
MTIEMSEYAASVVARVRCVTTFDAEGFPARKVGCNPRHQLVVQPRDSALAACKKYRARLVIAKLERLFRNLAFIATLMDSGVEFIVVDKPRQHRPGRLRCTCPHCEWPT